MFNRSCSFSADRLRLSDLLDHESLSLGRLLGLGHPGGRSGHRVLLKLGQHGLSLGDSGGLLEPGQCGDALAKGLSLSDSTRISGELGERDVLAQRLCRAFLNLRVWSGFFGGDHVFNLHAGRLLGRASRFLDGAEVLRYRLVFTGREVALDLLAAPHLHVLNRLPAEGFQLGELGTILASSRGVGQPLAH